MASEHYWRWLACFQCMGALEGLECKTGSRTSSSLSQCSCPALPAHPLATDRRDLRSITLTWTPDETGERPSCSV